MLVSLTIAAAAGMNPYVALLVASALIGLTSRVTVIGPLATIDPAVWKILVSVGAVGCALDLTLGKIARHFERGRITSLAMSTGLGLLSGGLSSDEWVVRGSVAVVCAVTSAVIAFGVSRLARAGLHSAAWVRMGHLPVMMASGVVAAIAIPLSLVLPAVSAVAVAGAIGALGFGNFLVGRRRVPETGQDPPTPVSATSP